MNDTLERNLIIKYPVIFDPIGKRPYAEVWGVECEDGWSTILDNLCGEIQSYLNINSLAQVRFSYVKEKFGELRVSCVGADQYVSELVRKAALESTKTCEWCGCAGFRQKLRSGWIKSLCTSCAMKEEARYITETSR